MRDKTIQNQFFLQHYNAALEWLRGAKMTRGERRVVVASVWPRRWIFYIALVTIAFVAGMGVRFWSDFSFAFQCGKIVGELNKPNVERGYYR